MNRRRSHRRLVSRGTSVMAQVTIAHWNQDPQPFTWTKTADEILERLQCPVVRDGRRVRIPAIWVQRRYGGGVVR